MKYIDAEKLIELVKEWRSKQMGFAWDAVNEVLKIISSIQREQPKVDLGEEIEKYYYENFAFISNEHIPTKDILSDIAVHFYELGLNAKKEK